MTSVLSSQRTQLSYSPRSARFPGATPSILLNSNMHRQPISLPSSSYSSRPNHHPSTQSLSSSASSSEDVNTPSSSDNATPPLTLSNSLPLPYTSDDDRFPHSRTASAPECVASTSRRSIRFAPLPVPRRAVLINEHGEEVPLPGVFDDDDLSVASPDLRNFSAQPSPSLLLGGAVVAPKQLSAIIISDPLSPRSQSLRPPPSSATNRPPSSPSPSTATVTLSKRFLPSFWHRSDDSRRPGSRDSSSSRDGSPPTFGIPLGHWVSADAAARRGSTSSSNGAPLVRAQSSSAPLKPKRLLNGRVYGARKHPHYLSANAFDNVPDKEPEFVEWGHGGMGSVRAGGMWSKVQSNQKLLIGHTEERGRRGTPAPPADDDDGSGMGWVKRRREERERKKLEEQSAREAASKTNVVPTSSPVLDDTPSPASTVLSVDHNVTTVTLSQPTPENDDDEEDEEEAKYDSLDDESSGAEQDDDDDAEEQHFKQVLGAGVERVSRHRD
ncbi:hypothetical protein EDB85DRAFT_2141530 [Lactarius pseudohatsudake]|nr:hypothetical protein EDB85DRAFT_2141530 [Lactarius pseudohatsudake]